MCRDYSDFLRWQHCVYNKASTQLPVGRSDAHLLGSQGCRIDVTLAESNLRKGFCNISALNASNSWRNRLWYPLRLLILGQRFVLRMSLLGTWKSRSATFSPIWFPGVPSPSLCYSHILYQQDSNKLS